MFTLLILDNAALTRSHSLLCSFRLKGFLVSSATMAGLVIEAEDVLQKYEQDQRIAYNLHRRWAKIGLAREGRVPTESELERHVPFVLLSSDQKSALTSYTPSVTLFSWIQENKHRFPRIEKGADGVVRKITPGAPPEPASADPSKVLSPDTTPRTQESTVEILSNGGSPALASSVWKK